MSRVKITIARVHRNTGPAKVYRMFVKQDDLPELSDMCYGMAHVYESLAWLGRMIDNPQSSITIVWRK